MRHPRATALLALGLAACQGDAGPGSRLATGELPVHGVGAPEQVIGVVEGDEAYLFQSIQGILPVGGGRVAVADAGGARVNLYDADGTFLLGFGGEGEGPGEFGTLARIYPHAGDSLLALDGWRVRYSVFALDGTFARQLDPAEITADTTWRADVWPHGRFLVDGALRPDARQRVRTALDALPAPYGASVARVAWWAGDRELWIRESRRADGGSTWLVVDGSGTPERWVDLPAGFLPLRLDGDVLWGRMVGEFDVEQVHRYRVEATGTSRPVPTWVSAPQVVPDSLEVDRDELLSHLRASMKYLASAQEIHYSQNYSYTDDPVALGIAEMELPEGLEVQILTAGTRGWAMLAAHPNAREICTLGYGFNTPPGWLGGAIRCGG